MFLEGFKRLKWPDQLLSIISGSGKAVDWWLRGGAGGASSYFGTMAEK